MLKCASFDHEVEYRNLVQCLREIFVFLHMAKFKFPMQGLVFLEIPIFQQCLDCPDHGSLNREVLNRFSNF